MFTWKPVLYLDATNTIVQGYSMWVDEIAIPEGVRLIRNEALRGMRKLKFVSLPESLETIQSRAFMGTGLRKVTIPKNVADIRLGAFANCGKLEEIAVSDKNRFFTSEDGILYNKERTILIQYPAGSAREAFSIPEGVVHIMPKAFAGCRNLKEIRFPQSLINISERAFCECNGIEKIVIPEWIKHIEKRAFAYCKSLRKVFLARGTYVAWGAFENGVEVIFTDDKTEMIDLPQEPLKIKMSNVENSTEIKSIVLSQDVVERGLFTTEIEHKFSTKCETYNATDIVDEIEIDGIVKVGDRVIPGQVLVLKTTAVPGTSPQSLLLAAISGGKPIEYKDSSLLVPYNADGVVTDVEIEYAKNKKGERVNPPTIETVVVTIKQRIKPEVGDIFVDEEGNECILEAIADDLDDYDIAANFVVAGRLTKKASAKQALQYRAVGGHSIMHKPIPTTADFGVTKLIVGDVPQCLTSNDLIKLVDQGFSEVIKNVLLNQSREVFNSVELYKNAVYGNKTTAFYMPYSYVNQFINFMYAMCIKPVFRDKNGYELHFSYNKAINELSQHYGEDITLELTTLSSDEIKNMSYGEVTKSDGINNHTQKPEAGGIFCERIFGPTRDWWCHCGRYKGTRHKGVICGNCGVEVTESKVRYERIGHIELSVPVKHPFLKDKTITVLPILPPELRLHIRLKTGQYLTSDLNDMYRRIINWNNQVGRRKEMGSPAVLLSADIERLQAAVNDLMLGSQAHNTSLLNELGKLFVKNMSDVPLDYSASSMVIPNKSLPDDQCALPYEVAATVFKPYLIAELCKRGICHNIKTAVKFADKSICDAKYENRPAVIKCLESVMNEKKVLLLSSAKDGKVLALTPILTTANIAMLSPHNYGALQSSLSEAVKIILPASDPAQDMLCDRSGGNMTASSFYDVENDTDYVKEISELVNSGQDIAQRLNEAINNKEICSFRTFVSRWIFAKPSVATWKNYELPVDVKEESVSKRQERFKKAEILGDGLFEGFGEESSDIDNMFDTGADDIDDIFSALTGAENDIFNIFGVKDGTDDEK